MTDLAGLRWWVENNLRVDSPEYEGLRTVLSEAEGFIDPDDDCAVELDDDRLDYVTVQVSRSAWERAKALKRSQIGGFVQSLPQDDA